MVPSDSLQVREVRNDSGLLAAEGQIDEVFHIKDPRLDRHGLELCCFNIVEAVQSFGKVIQLVDIDSDLLQPLEDGKSVLDLFHLTVTFHDIAKLHCAQELHYVIVFLIGDGQRDRGHAIFRMLYITQYCSHRVSPPRIGRTASPYRRIIIASTIRRSVLSSTSSGSIRSV